jgi:hypothetical protein
LSDISGGFTGVLPKLLVGLVTVYLSVVDGDVQSGL